MTLDRPVDLSIPDLGHLSARDRLTLASEAGVDASSHAVLLARLVDRAVGEWGRAHESAVASQGGPGEMHGFMRAVNHMEAFIGTLKRAANVASGMRRDDDAIDIDKPELPSQDDRKRLNSLRQAIEQMDGPGHPSGRTYLVLNERSVELDGTVCGYDELAWWLCQIEDVAVRAIES